MAAATSSLLPGYMDSLPQRVGNARAAYKAAAERMSNLCYEIQVQGRLPDPAALTAAVVSFLHARDDRDYLEQLQDTVAQLRPEQPTP